MVFVKILIYIKFSGFYIKDLKYYNIKTSKKRDISNNLKVQYTARKWIIFLETYVYYVKKLCCYLLRILRIYSTIIFGNILVYLPM